jgi:hypothetical protein
VRIVGYVAALPWWDHQSSQPTSSLLSISPSSAPMMSVVPHTICPTVGIFEQCTIAAELEIVTRFDGCLVFEHFTSARSNVTPDSYCASETYDVAGWSVRIVG